MKTQEILNNKFDMETHKNNFINYLEIVILDNGEIEYAVPSHNKKLEMICCKKLGFSIPTRYEPYSKELTNHFEEIYKNNWWEWENFLFETSGAICVWHNMYKGCPNAKQLEVLKKLKDYELYKGEI